MYVCLCNAVSDKVIRKAIEQHRPINLQQLRQLVPVGNGCGKCLRQTKAILQEMQHGAVSAVA